MRGQARVELKSTMDEASADVVYSKSIDEANVEVAQAGNLQGIVSRDVLHKIRQEKREENQLDKNDVADLQMRAENGRIPDLVDLRTFQNFTATFINRGALELLSNHNNSTNVKTLLLDATGGITRKIPNAKSPTFHHVLLLPIEKPSTMLAPGDSNQESYLIPVAELITNDSTGFAISQFLRLVAHNLRKFHGEQKLCEYIGTDFSWPNFFAILDLNGWTMKTFLRYAYETFENGKLAPQIQHAILPASCFSHMCKCMKKDINKFYTEKEDQKFIARLIGEIVDIPKPLDLDVYIKDLIVVIGTKFKNDSFKSSFNRLKVHYNLQDAEDEENDKECENENEEDEFVEYKSIYRSSKFFQRFENFEKTISNQISDDSNKYYSVAFLQLFLSKYIAFLPTWTIFIGILRNDNYRRGNNARIERFFQGLKENVKERHLQLRHLGSVHVGDYAEFACARTETLVKEAKIGVPGRKKSRGKNTGIENKREKWWKGKSKTRKSAIFLNSETLVENFSQE